jgi:hypothetical protein
MNDFKKMLLVPYNEDLIKCYEKNNSHSDILLNKNLNSTEKLEIYNKEIKKLKNFINKKSIIEKNETNESHDEIQENEKIETQQKSKKTKKIKKTNEINKKIKNIIKKNKNIQLINLLKNKDNNIALQTQTNKVDSYMQTDDTPTQTNLVLVNNNNKNKTESKQALLDRMTALYKTNPSNFTRNFEFKSTTNDNLSSNIRNKLEANAIKAVDNPIDINRSAIPALTDNTYLTKNKTRAAEKKWEEFYKVKEFNFEYE